MIIFICFEYINVLITGADPGFQVRGAHLKKLRRAEGGAKIFGVFRVKNHDFTPKNHIFFNCRGRRENFWGISCEKSRFYAKKIIFFPILGGARAGCAPPESAPVYSYTSVRNPVWILLFDCIYCIYVIQWYIESCKMLCTWKKINVKKKGGRGNQRHHRVSCPQVPVILLC